MFMGRSRHRWNDSDPVLWRPLYCARPGSAGERIRRSDLLVMQGLVSRLSQPVRVNGEEGQDEPFAQSRIEGCTAIWAALFKSRPTQTTRGWAMAIAASGAVLVVGGVRLVFVYMLP